jgi:hypothetical protein
LWNICFFRRENCPRIGDFGLAASRLERYFLCEKGEGEFSHRLEGLPFTDFGSSGPQAVDGRPAPTTTSGSGCVLGNDASAIATKGPSI